MDFALLRFFGKPLGALINKGLTAAAAGVLGWSAAKGNPLGDVSPLVSALVLAISTVISGLAATQGVQIPIINESENGLKVVKDSVVGKTENAPLG